ncbi:linear amide C-N hydrolase [candidate division KSB1 bacterium]
MKKTPFITHVVLIAAIFFYFVSPCNSCTTFVLKNGSVLLFGKNLDLYTSKGFIVINKRDTEKYSLILPPEKPVHWTSKYGSITFNQVGKEFPFGGMNETGFVVEMMQLNASVFPSADERPAIMEIQYIQYLLDNCSTVEEAIQLTERIRLSQKLKGTHFLVCDGKGKTAVIEFLNGKLVYHTGEAMPVTALTNDTYKKSLWALDTYNTFEPEKQKGHNTSHSLDRFVNAARMVENFKSVVTQPAVDYAFDILKTVGKERSRSSFTVWSIVYDIKNLKIYFRTENNGNIRIVDFIDFDFSGESASTVYDLSGGHKGNIAGNFIDYSTKLNRKIIRSVLDIYIRKNYIRRITDMEMEMLATFPEKFTGK